MKKLTFINLQIILEDGMQIMELAFNHFVVLFVNTICYDILVDIDNVNSHPTILKHVMDKYNLKSPLLEEYLSHGEFFLKKVIKDEKCSRDTAKTYVIAVINGNKYVSSTLKKKI